MAIRDYEARFYVSSLANVKGEEITEYVREASITIDDDATYSWTLSLSLGPQYWLDGNGSLDWQWVMPELDVYAWNDLDGETVETGQVGLFQLLPGQFQHTSADTVVTHTGHDPAWLLDNDDFTDAYTLEAGVHIGEAISEIAAGVGWTRLALTVGDRVLPNTRSWEPQTTRLKVCNDLLAGIACYRLMSDRTGRGVSFPYRSLSGMEPRRTISSLDGDVSFDVPVTADPDQMWNAVSVVAHNGADEPIVVRLVNDRADSPVSTTRLGLTRSHPITDANVSTEADALALARRILEEGATYTKRMQVFTPPDIAFDLKEVLAVDIVKDSGEQVASGNWWWDELQLDLRPRGPMRWSLNRIEPWQVEAS